MSKMEELYEKVVADSALQEKFTEIIKDAEKMDKEAEIEKLMAFAKDEGYEVTLEEMAAFFENLGKDGEGELSDVELDMVAGGKGGVDIGGSINFLRRRTERDIDNFQDDPMGFLKRRFLF